MNLLYLVVSRIHLQFTSDVFVPLVYQHFSLLTLKLLDLKWTICKRFRCDYASNKVIILLLSTVL